MFNADSSVVISSQDHSPRYLRGRSRDVNLRAYQVRRNAEVMHIDAASIIRQLGA